MSEPADNSEPEPAGADTSLESLLAECLRGIPDHRLPTLGSDVFVFGYPLARQQLQRGVNAVASTFKGVLSHAVDGYPVARAKRIWPPPEHAPK